MRDDPPVAEMMEIASCAAPLPERARGLLQWLERGMCFDAAWLALSDPRSNVYATLGSTGLDRPVLDYLDRPAMAALIARGLSPMRSLLATARIVKGATAGAVLLQDGTTCPLPGLRDHALLAADSPVMDIARATLLDGQVYRSFMWPTRDGSAGGGHLRMTVLAATELPAFVLGAILVTPDADCRDLTPRELQVLGLLVDGHSNQQIARRLAVAPRTIAAHVEHLLDKLEAPNRTFAAVRAEREGCYVPPPPDRPPWRRH